MMRNEEAEVVLVCDIQWRNPFTPGRLPWLARLYRYGYSPAGRTLGRVTRKGAREAFNWVYRAGLGGGSGTFLVNAGGRSTKIEFAARNLQFQSVYMPQYENGAEPTTAALLDALVGDDGIFYDVGSNWGYYALLIATRKDFRGKVHAFEPMPDTFADLQATVRAAGLEQTIACHNFALSDRDGTQAMSLPDGIHSGNATITGATHRGTGVEVALKRIDSLTIPTPNVIKLDVEEHELQVLAGATRILEEARPMIVFENWARPDRPAATFGPFKLLRDKGYRFFQPGWWRSVNGTGFADVSANIPASEFKTLALLPFEVEQRFSLETMFNVFACHQDQMAVLQAMFRPAQ